jgi:TPR repeat protein
MYQTFEEIRRLAEQGLTGCQIEVGNSYLTGRDPNGDPCDVNFELAKQWLERAHKKGASTATFILGTVYEDGKGVPADIGKAIELYVSAADRGAYLPCLHLARIYANGKGVPRSPSIAAEWYRRVLAVESEVDDSGAMIEARHFLAQTR